MRIEKLINGQAAICAMLCYDDKRKIIAHEITIHDLLDYSDPRGEASMFGVLMCGKYYTITIKNRVVEKIERVSKQTALKYALA